MPDDSTPSESSATTGGIADEPGCGCRSPKAPPAGPFAAGLLALLALRSRRRGRGRPARSLMATVGLAGLLATACSGDPSTTDNPTTTTTGAPDTDTDTDTDTDSLPTEPDPRLFGTFHSSFVHPGWSTEHYPDYVLGYHGHRILTLSLDGLARVEFYECFALFGGISSQEEFLAYDELLSWTFVPELGGLLIESDEQEDSSEWTKTRDSMVIVPHPECDGSLEVTTSFKSGDTSTRAYRPGRLCADFSDSEKCRYTLQWCNEGEPGPLCPEPYDF